MLHNICTLEQLFFRTFIVSICCLITFSCCVILLFCKNRTASSTRDHLSSLLMRFFVNVVTNTFAPVWKASNVKYICIVKVGIPDRNSADWIHRMFPVLNDTTGAQNVRAETFDSSSSKVTWSASINAFHWSSSRLRTVNDDFFCRSWRGGGVGISLGFNPVKIDFPLRALICSNPAGQCFSPWLLLLLGGPFLG